MGNQSEYDLTLRGGHVIDPANGIDEPMDVAITCGSIAAVANGIRADRVQKIVDVSGLYVTPGLIDIHRHVSPPEQFLFPDGYAVRSGVTTVVDAGSTGLDDFPTFKADIIDRCRTRVLAFLNICACGIGPLEQDVGQMDPVATAAMIGEYPDVLVGVKTAHYMGAGWESIDHAVHAGRLAHKPVMMDVHPLATRSYEDMMLKHMRPGDIVTHCYHPRGPIIEDGKAVSKYAVQARERGIIFDVGHGSGSFHFRIAVPAIAQGFLPDTISTDLHRNSVLLPNATMIATMSKLLSVGLPLGDAILRSSVNPARVIGRTDLGTLSVGASADVAVLELRRGEFSFVDSAFTRFAGELSLACHLTVRGGRVVWDPGGLTAEDWQEAARTAAPQPM